MDLLKTDVKKLYGSYLFPSLMAAIITSIYGFVDMIAIGRGVGPDGAAALSIATPIFGVISFFGILCGVGGSVYFGKARGENNVEKSQAYFTASFFLTVVLTVVVWIVFGVFSRQIYIFFGSTEHLMPLVHDYTKYIILTMPFFVFSSYLGCMVRSDGAPNKVMAAVIIGGVLNVFGDWLFVFPFGWGMVGAALATVLGTVVQFLILCSHFFNKKCTLKMVKPFRFGRAFRNIAFAGFSASVIDIAFIILTVLLNKQVLRYGGEVALAVFGVVITCSSLFQHIFSGVGQAIQPIVSTNFGAGQMHRIHQVDRLSIATSLFLGVLFAAIGLLFPLQITSLFVETTPEIMEIAPGIIRIYFLSFLPLGVNIQATYYLQSILKTRPSTILALLRGLIISGILVYLLPLALGISGVWWAMTITEVIVVILTLTYVYRIDKES